MTATDEERLARVALNCAGEPGSLEVAREVAIKGAVQAYDDLLTGRSVLTEDLSARLRRIDPSAQLRRGAELGVRFTIPGDDEWPGAIEDLAFAEELHQRGGPPVGLWLRGAGNLEEMARHAVAVVGSRTATSYGCQVAADIGAVVAAKGYTVVSGAALGIDFHAHRGALAVSGPTIAVLAGGVERPYPQKHAALLDHIASTGLVLSEAPLGAASMRVRFLARNRLIAALSAGTVVVEAAVRSGALNTASWTVNLGRTLMGVPGPVTSPASQGVHQLIRTRGAVLVSRPAEVLETVGPIGSFLLTEPRGKDHPRDFLTVSERQVLDAVPVARAASTESVARTAGVRPQRACQALKRLVDVGLVEQAPAGWRAIREAPGFDE